MKGDRKNGQSFFLGLEEATHELMRTRSPKQTCARGVELACRMLGVRRAELWISEGDGEGMGDFYRFSKEEGLYEGRKEGEGGVNALIKKAQKKRGSAYQRGEGGRFSCVLWDGEKAWGCFCVCELDDEREESFFEMIRLYASSLAGHLAQVNLVAQLHENVEMYQREQRFLKTLFVNIPDCIYFKDREHRFLRVNQGMAGKFGVAEPSYMLGKTDKDFFTDEHAEDAWEDEEEVMRTGMPIVNKLEKENWIEGGGETWSSTTKMPFFDEDGSVIGTFGVSRDVTHEQGIERAIKDSERLFRSIWDSCTDGMCLTDEDGVILNANEAYCEMFDARKGEVSGELIWAGYEGEGGQKEMKGFEWVQGFDHGRTRMAVELVKRLKNGKEVHVEVTFARFQVSDGEWRYVSLFRDVSERKQAEAERMGFERKLLQAQRLESLGLMAGGIAHDFNNMLTGIIGNTSLALLDLAEDSEAFEDLKAVEQSCVQAAELCQQMLAYSGKGQLEVKVIRLNQLVDQMLSLLKASVKGKVSLKVDLDGELPPVSVDVSQMRQVILNLVINGSDAIGEKSGTITIRSGMVQVDEEFMEQSSVGQECDPGDYIFLEVTDTGSGISPENLEKIFDPFFTTKFTGRGLGLAAVMGIVRGHGGALRVKSEVGKGTTFLMLLPSVVGEAEDLQVESNGRCDWKGEGKVLIVDDERDVREVLEKQLKRLGFSVLVATGGAEGVKLYEEYGAELKAVFLDVVMPEVGGRDVLREVKRFEHGVPIVMMSGYSQSDVMSQFEGEGVEAFLNKPFRVENVERVLKKALNVDGG